MDISEKKNPMYRSWVNGGSGDVPEWSVALCRGFFSLWVGLSLSLAPMAASAEEPTREPPLAETTQRTDDDSNAETVSVREPTSASTTSLQRPAAARTRPVEFRLSPSHARLSIDGQPALLGPNNTVRLAVGDHVVRVEAVGHEPVRMSIAVVVDEMPPVGVSLVPAATPPSPTSRAEVAGKPRGPRVMAATSLALLAAGAAVGLSGLAPARKADRLCEEQPCDDPAHQKYDDRATRLAMSGEALFYSGVGGALTSLVWYLHHRRAPAGESQARTTVTPEAGPTGAGVRIRGSF